MYNSGSTLDRRYVLLTLLVMFRGAVFEYLDKRRTCIDSLKTRKNSVIEHKTKI